LAQAVLIRTTDLSGLPLRVATDRLVAAPETISSNVGC